MKDEGRWSMINGYSQEDILKRGLRHVDYTEIKRYENSIS